MIFNIYYTIACRVGLYDRLISVRKRALGLCSEWRIKYLSNVIYEFHYTYWSVALEYLEFLILNMKKSMMTMMICRLENLLTKHFILSCY
jgi:hypothetical protein